MAIYLTESAYADSWGAPKQFEAVSENKQFVATVKPSRNWKSPTLTVSRLESKRRTTIWRTQLHNSVSPISVRVSDDGSSVITFDNWGSVGYGDDVVGIYGSEGLRANYSLRDFAPPPVLDDRAYDRLPVQKRQLLRERLGY